MPTYEWEGRTGEGVVKRGTIEAESAGRVEEVLRAQGISAVKVKEKGRRGFDLSGFLKRFTLRIKAKEIMVFTRQFATMIGAGLPLVQSLEILSTEQTNKALKEVLTDIKKSVEEGSNLADAMRKHPGVFDDLYVNLVQSAEMGGVMEQVLNRLALYIEKAEELKGRVKSAMTYPVIVLVVAVGVVAVILTYVIPTFQKMFVSFGGALPTPTKVVIAMSNFMRSNLHFIVLGVIALIFGIRQIYRTPQGKKAIDTLMLKIPMIQSLLVKVAVARFSRTLSTMLASGVPILEAIGISAGGIGNVVIREALDKVREDVSQGKELTESLKGLEVFPGMVVQMIGVGEKTGALDQMLSKIADFYEEEVDAAVGALASLIEPFMVVFLGVVVGGLLVSMYLPIFKLATLIK